MLAFVRTLTPEQKAILIKINKDKKRWYREANEASGNKLFKTSFHDYAHSAPKTTGDLLGIPTRALELDDDSEVLARYTEDSLLQGLPWSVPRNYNTRPIQVMRQASEQPDIRAAYDALYSLGKYSVEKKNGLQPGTYTPAKVMLNKFSYTSTIEFGNPLNKIKKNDWLINKGQQMISPTEAGDILIERILPNVPPGLRAKGGLNAAAKRAARESGIEDQLVNGYQTTEDLVKKVHQIRNKDFTDLRLDSDSGQYVGFPKVNGYMEMPVPNTFKHPSNTLHPTNPRLRQYIDRRAWGGPVSDPLDDIWSSRYGGDVLDLDDEGLQDIF